MSAENRGSTSAAWHPQTNPALDDSGADSSDSDLADERPDVPTPEERLRGLADKYPDRMATPLATEHGRKLRDSCLQEPVETVRQVNVGEGKMVDVADTVAQEAAPLGAAVSDLLTTYEDYRDMFLRMEKRQPPGKNNKDFYVDLHNSFSPEYQTTQYAKLKGLDRQLIGGDYPNNKSCEGLYDDPVTVLFGLTSSCYNQVGSATSGRRPPVDHDREIRDAWTGSTSSVKRTLRYVLEDKLGLESEDYAWWFQSEPHTGNGPAAGLSHAHPFVVLDASEANIDGDDISPSTFRPVVAKHIAECDGAEWSGHEIHEQGGEESAVTVRKGDEIRDVPAYVSEYLAIGPDTDLLERSDEYLMWAASQWASSTQKYSKDRTATAAITADRCQQRAMNPGDDQDLDHGERIMRSNKRGIEFACACCGSHHGIDQDHDSLALSRLDPSVSDSSPSVVADGGEDSIDDEPPETFADRWPSADAAARVSEPVRERECGHDGRDQCPLCATETEAPNHTVPGETPIPDDAVAQSAEVTTESKSRIYSWEPKSIVRVWLDEDDDDRETLIGSPGGVDYGEVVIEGHDSILSKCDIDNLPPARRFEGPEPWTNDIPFDEADVRSGRCPPPELIERERKERGLLTVTATGATRSVDVCCPECGYSYSAHPNPDTLTCIECGATFSMAGNTADEVVTAKNWREDWYSRRFNQGSEADKPPDSGAKSLSKSTCERIRELVERGVTSVPAVCGDLMIDPDYSEAVATTINEVSETA